MGSRPRLRHQRPLHLDRHVRANPRRGEHRQDLIALADDFLTARRGQPCPDQLVMTSQPPVSASPSCRDSTAKPSMPGNKKVCVATSPTLLVEV
jgi:hypothetical protein